MTALTPEALAWLGTRQQAVLVTLRADGLPQTSNVLTRFDGEAFRFSVTAGRAKTKNLIRDGRAIVHVLGEDFWSYASVACTASVGPVSETPGDEAGRELLALRDALDSAPHPDPDEFYAAMVKEERLVLSLHPESITGSGWA